MGAPISFKDVVIELSTDGAVWQDASGEANQVQVSGGDRAVAEFFSPNSDTPQLTFGKRAAIDIAVNAIYTEIANEPFEMANDSYENNTDLYVRWKPKGTGAGKYQYTSGAGRQLTPVYPGGDASSADPVPLTINVKVATVSKAVQV